MTERKNIAKSIHAAIESYEMDHICDLTTTPEVLFADADKIIARWQHDLFERRPAPALADDRVLIQATDLDFASFAAALATRGAVINVPKYRSRRQASAKRDNETRIIDQRYGKITALVSNKDVFSFSVRIEDLSVLVDGKPGAPRNLMAVDVDGQWHDGWKRFGFAPSRAENDFIEKFALAHEGEIQFTNFVHPNRWQSFFGANYLLAKSMVHRLADLASHYRAEAKRLLPLVGLGNTATREAVEGPDFSIQEDRDPNEIIEDVQVESLQCEVEYVAKGALPMMSATKTSYEACKAIEKETRGRLEALRYATRATEFAFWNLGKERMNLRPHWIGNATWEEEKEKRTVWNRLKLVQREVGERAVGLRFRVTTPTTKIREYSGR